ncbi:hypothetical protein MSP7336_01785 [Mycobacterium shimoidei]|uniref:Uncharacterized protein n=2 Tax=Mycobacterium shimoidei TaxID=29313 RepID=A0A375YXG9_MYCSH|nr:hypothetical protein MSP7336_01785 [Mycobacterium shimoidei]
MIELAGLLITNIFAVVAIWLHQHFQVGKVDKKVDQVCEHTGEIRQQVHNTHPMQPNLRDDIDYLKRVVTNVADVQVDHGRDIRGLRQDLGGLRGELRDERETRRREVELLSRKVDEYRERSG